MAASGASADEELFGRVFERVRRKYIQNDFDREEKLEEKRDLRTNKYGVPIEKENRKPGQVQQRRAPRNEIELEFLKQDEKERAIADKYRDQDSEEEPEQDDTFKQSPTRKP